MVKTVLNKKFTSDSLITISALIIIGLCGLLINLIIQNNFNKEGLGIFSYIFSIFFIIVSVGTFGMNRAMVYFSAYYFDRKKYRNQLITNSILLIITWSSLLLITIQIGLVTFANNFFTNEQNIYLKIISYAVPFYCVNNVGIAVLNGLRRMKIYSFLRSLRWISLILCLVVLSSYQLLKFVFYSFIISEIIIFIILVYIFFKSKYIQGFYIKNCLIEILSYIKYVFPSQILVSLNENIDIILLENYLSEGGLGVYSFSSKIAKSLGLIGNAIQTNFNPIISSHFKNNSIAELKQLCFQLRRTCLKIFSFLIFFIGLIYFCTLQFFIDDVSYKEVFNFYILQSLGAGLYAAFAWAGGMLIMTGKIKENINRTLFKLFFNMILLLSCINIFPSEIGAYIGFTLFMISQLIIDREFIYKYLRIKIF